MKRFLIFILLLAAPAWPADYVFGGDSTATGQIQIDTGVVWVDTISSPAVNTGSLDSGIVWFNPYGEARQLQIVVYDYSTNNIIDSTAKITTGTQSALTRQAGAFINGGTIDASTKYYIGVFYADDPYSFKARVGYLTTQTTNWKYTAVQNPAVLPASIAGASATNVGRIPAFVYYSDGGGPAPTTATKHLAKGKLKGGHL